MYTIILGLHVFVCFLLIMAVLLQSGKGSDLGSALGGGASEMFGPGAPANVMNKITTVIAVMFLFTSLTLAVLSTKQNSDSVLRSMPVNTSAPAKQAPAAPTQSVPGMPAQSAPAAPAPAQAPQETK